MVVFLIIRTLIANSDISQKELIKLTKISERSLRNKLKLLIKKNIVHERDNFEDMRSKIYKIKEIYKDQLEKEN